MKTIKIEDFLDFKYVSRPGFSPDGRSAVFVVQQADPENNNYSGDLYLLDVETCEFRQITSRGDVKTYLWTEDGQLIFPAAGEGDEQHWYSALEEETSEPLLTLPVKAKSIVTASEGKYVFTATFDNNADEPEHECYEAFDEAPFWEEGGSYTSGKRRRLYTFDSIAGKLVPVTGPWTEVKTFVVHGQKIMYAAFEWRGAKSENTLPGLYIYDMETCETKCIIVQDMMRIDVLEFLDDNTVMMTASDNKKHGLMQNLYLYLVDISSGSYEVINEYEYSIGDVGTASDARLGGGTTAKEAGGKLWFLTTVGESTFLRTADREGKMSEYLTPVGSCDSFDVHGENILTCGLFGQKLTALYLNGKQVTFFNDEWEAKHSIAVPEHYTFKDSDGFEVHGWAMKPAGYEPGKKYPAILHIHGGPRTAFGEVYHHEMQMWASSGYFVFFCNPRGSDGYGDDFADIQGRFGTVDYDNVMQFMDEMLAAYPDVDAARVGVTGGSYGGFMTNWIIGHTDRFKAAVSQRSTANWITFEHTSDIGAVFTYKTQTARTRTDIEKVWNHSPLKYADKCTTPTLFIHSDKDHRCWMVEGIQMFTAIKMNGCEARMCLFHDECHDLSRSGKPQSRISRMKEILAWMDKYLKN